MEEGLASSATDTPVRRLEVCLCQCLCSSEEAYLPLCLRKWDSSIEVVDLTLPPGMDDLPELSEQKDIRSRRSRSLRDIRGHRSRSHSRLRDIPSESLSSGKLISFDSTFDNSSSRYLTTSMGFFRCPHLEWSFKHSSLTYTASILDTME